MTRTSRRRFQARCESLEGRQLLSGYYIINAYNGKVIDDPRSSTANGYVEQYQLTGGTNQQWNLVPLSNGNFEMVNVASGKAMEDPGFSRLPGTLHPAEPAHRQPQPAVEAQPPARRQLQDRRTRTANRCSTTRTSGPPTAPRSSRRRPSTASTSSWELAGAGSAPVSTNYIDNAYSGKVVDDTGFSVQNGTGMQQYQLTGGYNQRLDGRATVRRLRRDRQPV